MRSVVMGMLAVLLTGCSLLGDGPADDGVAPSTDTSSAIEDAPTEPGPGTIPFHLDVSNQSFQEPDVRLRVWLDDVPIIDESFPVMGQHHVVRHDLHLEPGDHTLRVAAPDDGFERDETFTVDAESWANVSFWGTSGNGPPLGWTLSLTPLVYG